MALTYKITKPSALKASVSLPASKSISNRALILNALAKGDTNLLSNISDCDDTNVMLKALSFESNDINIGAAGTSMRFLTAFLSTTPGTWNITGSERMKQRPIKILVDALRKIGADIEYTENEGFPPLRINGKELDGGEIELDGSVSSQYISALLMIAPKLKNGLSLRLTGEVISKPYIKMTLSMMNEFGIESRIEGNLIEVKPQTYRKTAYEIENDWSGASYWYEMAAINKGGEIELKGLRKNSTQGDSKIAEMFKKYGVNTDYTESGVTLSYDKSLECTDDTVEIDFVEQPDMAQTFVVTSCALNRKFHFCGLRSLKIKETDRIAALITELKKLGYALTEPKDGELAWDGAKLLPQRDAAIDTYEDHRMALSFAPFSLTNGSINIRNPHVVSKSYPDFWNDITKAGFAIEESDQ
ncbi:MAG: 3-phosphoshikimate 1-carboxyvinyltransferase [Paludibacteraceae bacterium]|nr:3-phosphoshikimate 1-carboxyvinyltransferase [Paludibacteraceae bacterium]